MTNALHLHVDDLSHHPDIESIEQALIFCLTRHSRVILQQKNKVFEAEVSSDRTVYTHTDYRIQMLFYVLKTRLVSGVSIGFNKNCFVVDVVKTKRSNNLIESEAHKTSEILVEINRTPYLMGTGLKLRREGISNKLQTKSRDTAATRSTDSCLIMALRDELTEAESSWWIPFAAKTKLPSHSVDTDVKIGENKQVYVQYS